MKNSRITMLLLPIIACSGFALAGEADNHPDAYVPFALTISGGVSLGSYEAGLNWALIHYLKRKRVEFKSKGKIYPQLKAITGASAGSINALVSAINWCVDKTRVEQLRNKKDKIYKDTINDNLFRDVWLKVGIHNLLPKSYETGYYRDDALLSRMALKPVLDNLTDLLSKPIYRDDCNIPIGFTVTRVEPTEISIAGVKVQNQRFMIPVTLHSVKPGSGRVQLQRLLMNNAVFNNVMYLPHKPDVIDGTYAVAAKDMLEAIQASSAFPVAFSRKELDYCRPNSHVKSVNDARSTRDLKCPPGYILDKAEFVDGGVFDNIPLGLVKMLAEPDRYNIDMQQLWRNSQRPFSYIFFDPSNRRAINPSTKMLDAGKTKKPSSDKRNGMLNQLSFLQGALVTGRQYELYTALRDDSWTKQTDFFWDKLTQKMNSKQMKNNNTFKEIRDNIEKLSKKYRGPIGDPVSDCRKKSCAGKITELRKTVINQMKSLASSIGEKQLALDISSASADKLGDRRLIRPTRFAPITGAMLFNFGAFYDEPFREYDYYAGVYDAVIKLAEYICCSKGVFLTEQIHEIYTDLGIPRDQKADTVFQILFEKEFGEQNLHEFIALSDKRTAFSHDPVMAILSQSLFNCAIKTNGLYQEPQFKTFLTELKKNDYIKYIDENNVLMRSAISAISDDPAQGEYYWAKDMVARVSERLIHLEDKQPLRLPIGIAALIAQDEFRDDEGNKFYMSRTTAPSDSSEAWWPYSIDIDVRNGGGTLSWEPGIRLGREWNAELKISPVHHNRFTDHEIWFSQIDLFLVHKVDIGALSSLAIGPTFTYTWKQWPDSQRSNIGSSIYMGFFKDRLRLTLGQRTGGASYADFPGDTAYIYISVTDLPGIYYWLIK